jgi:hypothetical protein
MKTNISIIKDVDVNGHEKLFIITLYKTNERKKERRKDDYNIGNTKAVPLLECMYKCNNE